MPADFLHRHKDFKALWAIVSEEMSEKISNHDINLQNRPIIKVNRVLMI